MAKNPQEAKTARHFKAGLVKLTESVGRAVMDMDAAMRMHSTEKRGKGENDG